MVNGIMYLQIYQHKQQQDQIITIESRKSHWKAICIQSREMKKTAIF